MSAARPRRRAGVLGVLAALVAATTVAVGAADPEAAAVRPAPRRAADSGAERVDSLPLERLKRAPMQVKDANAFRAKSWYVPPPPPPPAPPPPPTAPPLPFTYLGKIQEPNGKLTIFLSGDNRVYLVTAGETINQTYHVDGIEDGKLALTYLPLQIKQFLSMGDAP